MKYFTLILSVLVLLSCTGKTNKGSSLSSRDSTKANWGVGQYLYLDKATIHTEKFCTIDENQNIGLSVIDTAYITSDGLNYTFCPWCCEDTTVEHIKHIIKQNENKPLHILYSNLKNDSSQLIDRFGYSYITRTYEEFEKALTVEPSSFSLRHRLYRLLQEKNYDVPKTYESFYTTLFVPISKDQSRARYDDEFFVRLSFWNGVIDK